jgi:hypothetical protein
LQNNSSKIRRARSKLQEALDRNDIKGYEVYSDIDNEKVGTVKNLLAVDA